MTLHKEKIFEKLSEKLDKDQNLISLLSDYFMNENEKKSNPFSPVESYDYLESYDTGIDFDSLTDMARFKTFRKDFYNRFKENVNSMCTARVFKERIPNLKTEVIFNDQMDDFIRINFYCDSMFFLAPTIYVNKSGIIYTKVNFINSHVIDTSYNPYSLYSKGDKSKFADVDDLPITVKILEQTIKNFSAHCRYDENFNNFSVEDSRLYGGLSEKNIISKYVHYLIEKFNDYCAQGKPNGFEVFSKETEEKLNKYESWFIYGAERQHFSNMTKDGFVEEKRPAEFIRDLQDVVNTKSNLVDMNNIGDYINNQREFLKEALNILSGLFTNGQEIMSVEESLEDFIRIVDNMGYDPLEKIACILEGYFDMPSNFGTGLDIARAVYCCADMTKEQLRKKNKNFYTRNSTNIKGLGIEEFAIVLHEMIKDGQVSFCKRLEIVEKGIKKDSFSLLRVSNSTHEQLAVIESEPYTKTVIKDGNIYVHACKNFEYDAWTKEFCTAFKLKSFFKALDHSFGDLSFDITDLVKTEVIIQNMMAEHKYFISNHSEETIGINLQIEYESVSHRMALKKRLKQEEINNHKEKYDRVFNFAFAVFGAFGVASSIVSILVSNATSKAISIGSIMIYLLIVLISYRNSKK